MDDTAKKLTLDLLRAWAESKDDASAVILGGRAYTPAEYVSAVEKDTPFGNAYCAFMEAAAKQAKRPLDEFLKDAIRPQPAPKINFTKLLG
ncbi:MAG: hypothetical protein PSY14_00800 [bacterium]|nr:hypothetical protein [bacterium]